MARHRIRVEVVNEEDVLQRITLLNATLMQVLTGARLVCLVESDYEQGSVEVVVDGPSITPNPAPGEVRVEYLPLGP